MMEEDKTKEEADSTILDAGGFGIWNYILLLLSLISCFLAAFSHLSVIYLAYPPTLYCRQGNLTLPYTCPELGSNEEICKDLVYDESVFTSTVVTEWNLVCERKALLPTLTFTYFIGNVFSILLTGVLSDYYGRRKLILISSIIHIIASWVAYLSPDYWLFLLARMVLGGTIHSVWAGLFVLVQETTPKGDRTFTAGVMNFGWNIGALVLCALAYFLRNWRNLQLSFALISLLMILYFFLIKESPRWLLVNGRTSEAKEVIIHIAERNRVNLDVDRFTKEFIEMEKNSIPGKKMESFSQGIQSLASQFLQLVLTPNMRIRTLLLAPTFFAVGMASYGIHFAARFSTLDLFAVSAIKEVANFLYILALMFIYQRVSRTKCLALCYSVAGIVGISFMLVPEHVTGARPAVLVIAQALFVGNYFLVDTYAPELFPTSTRNFAFNIMDSVSKTGSAIAPYIVDLGGDVDPGLPAVVFGAILLFASINFYVLPETQGQKLPDSVDEIERSPAKTIIKIPWLAAQTPTSEKEEQPNS